MEKQVKLNEKKLKIALFIDTFYPMIDGVIQVVDNYAKRLCKTHDVTVFTIKPRKKGFDDSTLPYKVVRCKRIKLPFLDYDMPTPKFDSKFKKAIFNEKFDIVHIHSPFGIGKLGVKYAKKYNVPVVATLHSQYYKDFLKESHSKVIAKLLLKNIIKVFNRCDECWAVNSEVANIYYNEYKINKMPLTRNNGTDMIPFDNLAKIEELKNNYKIKENQKIFLFVGRLTILKNILFIAESLKILKDKNFNFKMIYVGSGPDEEILKAKIKELGLVEGVILTGKISDRNTLACIYKMSNLFLFPSLYDCSSLVQIEASCQSTPCVFIKGSATSATVTDQVNGYLSENSVEDFANTIIKIFENKKQYEEVCLNCHKDLYVTWDDAVKLAEKDYFRLIDAKK